MAEARVALVTHGAGGLTMPPIEMLRAAGVLVFAGNDDIRDTWSPYGSGDLLERAAIIGWKGDFRRARMGGGPHNPEWFHQGRFAKPACKRRPRSSHFCAAKSESAFSRRHW